MKLITNRKYFLLFFIFYVFANTLCLQFFGITRNPLFIPVFLWGLLLLGYDLWKKELFYKNSHLGIIGLYGVVLLLATYLNKTYSNFDSYLIWGMQMIVFLLIFGKKKGMSLTMLKDEMRSIIPFTTILTLAASGLSLLTFFLNISLTRNGWYLGLVDGRLFGVYFNCNPAAFLACMMMVFSMLAIRNKYKFSILYYVNFGVQLLYIILSGCRTALIVVMLIAVAIMYFKLFKEHGFSRIKQIGLSIFICVTILFGSSIIQKALYVDYSAIGLYSNAVTIANILTILQAGFNIYWVPLAYENYKNNKDKLIKIHRTMAFLLISFALCIIFFQDYIYLLLGERFRAGKLFFPFLILTPICNSIADATGIGIMISKKSYKNIYTFITNTSINFLLCFILIPKIGVAGGAIAAGMSALSMLMVRTYIGSKYYKLNDNYWYLFLSILALVVTAFINWIFQDFLIVRGLSCFFALTFVIFIYRKEVKYLYLFIVNEYKHLRKN